MQDPHPSLPRRQFVKTLGAGALGAGMAALGTPRAAARSRPWTAQELRDKAPDGPLLKAGLIGCGGRGTGAAFNYLNSGPNVTIAALADVFPDRLGSTRDKLKKDRGIEISDDHCFVGFDAAQQLVETDVDVVLIATPPHFRPEQFRAAINARKHVFMEKPVAVDPVGARSIMASAKKADVFGLCVVTGTQRRHQRNYLATYKQVMDGAIGDIVGANCYWNQGQLWYRNREEGWSDMEWMIRDWVNWAWLSGDHICEQHIHNIDVVNWFSGSHPKQAVGFGGRHRRVTGDQYDFFSIDFTYENDFHVHSMCRQINGCVNNVSELVMGTKGYTNCSNRIWALDGKEVWKYEGKGDPSPYDLEHVDLVTAIRTEQPINEAENTAVSTMCAIMGRISAYTGKQVTWDEMMGSDLRIGPTEYALGPVDIKAESAVPGT